MSEINRAVKGTNDILPSESYKYKFIEDKSFETAALYGFKEIRVPVFEHTEVFSRNVGDTTDVVQKEMYTFEDKGGRSITLRPELTAGTARSVIEHGLLNGALPLKIDETLAVFGRIQEHYYKSGTGSGGLVNVTRVWNITEGLEECGITLEPTLRAVYAAWEAENPIDKGVGWGGEPWSQREMPLTDEVCAAAAKAAPAALCIIGRTAGEEQDQSESGGSYLLSDTELEMLRTVRRHFRKRPGIDRFC